MKTTTRIRQMLLSLAAVTLFSAAASARTGELNASLSAREAYVGAPITLQLEIANASSYNEPVLSDVGGLDIQSAGSPSRSTQTTIINGRRTERTSAVYAWRITPRREGAFVIPGISFQVDGKPQTTRPLRFVATKSEAGDLLLVDVTGQQQKIFVGQPLKLTLNIWIKPYRDAGHQLTVSEADTWRMISDATSWGPFTDRLTELANNNQRPGGEELLRKDTAGAEHSYYRYQIGATIYPKRPGRIHGDDMQVVVDYPTRLAESRDPFDSMFDSDFFKSGPFGARDFSPFNRKTLTVAASRPLVAQATVAPIEVMPVPTAGRPADYRGAVGQYRIVTHAEPTNVKAGDPITLHIGITGDGPMDLVQAPPLVDLPRLTAEFKFANEPLAGLVEGDAKLFTTTIRPRQAGITKIPAIALSYFDPATKKFVTVYSDPIAIEVAESDRLALGSIVGATKAGANRPETSGKTSPQLDLSNDTGTEAVVSKPAQRTWPLVLALLVPPLVVALLWGFRHRQRLVGSLRGTARQQLRGAQQAIEDAPSPSDVAVAVKCYVAGYLQRPSASLARSEIVSGLRSRGYRVSAQRLDDVLARCEQAMYAKSEDGQLTALKSSALTSLVDLASANLTESGAAPAPPNQRRRVMAIACLVLAAIAVTVPAVALATRHRAGASDVAMAPVRSVSAKASDTDVSNLRPSQRTAIFSEANDAYQQGLKASDHDAATAQEAFSTAAGKYQLLLDSGVRNSQLYCNLANAYLQSGSLGRAIANYERALLLDPTNAKALTNLEAARQGVSFGSSDSTAEFSLSNTLEAFAAELSRFLSPSASAMLLAAAWMIFCGTLFARFYGSWQEQWRLSLRESTPFRGAKGDNLPKRRWRYALVPATCLLLACIALVGLDFRRQPQGQQAIVATQTAVLRQAPGESFPAVTGQPLPEGQSLTVLQDRNAWLQVQTPDGQTGWAAAVQIERVAPL